MSTTLPPARAGGRQTRRVFLTGATGFIGRQVARKLLERNDALTCLVRTPTAEAAQQLQALGATLVQGDITQPETMRPAMSGADVVFHLAGWYKVGVADASPALPVNVQGTRSVLELAIALEVPTIVYTSTVGVLGDTHRRVVDQDHQRDAPFWSEYTRSKTMAHEIALEMIGQGAPIRIAMPGAVYGPGDHSPLAAYLRLYLRGLLPVIPGANSGITLVHVEDVAEGHILVAEKGLPGHTYVLAGPPLTYGDMLRLVAHAAGRPAPILLSSWSIPPLIRLARLVNRFWPLPTPLHPETLQNLNGVTFWASGERAERELGWRMRPLEEGVAETVAWELAHIRRR